MIFGIALCLMRNLSAILIFMGLAAVVAIAAVRQYLYAEVPEWGMFIVTAMAALGTCGVTIFSVFPYVPADRLEAKLCKRSKGIWIMIYNKGNHTVYLGVDKYHTAEYWDAYAVWWPDNTNCTEKNSKHPYVKPGDNVAISPKATIGYKLPKSPFGQHDINKVFIQVMTSSRYRIDVQKDLT